MAANRNVTLLYGTAVVHRLTTREALNALLSRDFERCAPYVIHTHSDGTTTQSTIWSHKSGATATLVSRFPKTKEN